MARNPSPSQTEHAKAPEGLLARLSGVSLSYQDDRGRPIGVLRDINLDVAEHEVVGVLGPSGCGKTSLLNILAGLVRPSAGACAWQPDLMSRRGIDMTMVFQKPTLLPWRTVEENVLLPYELAELPIDESVNSRAETLFRLVRLQGFRSSRPHELSGGMQMRVALVRAFLTQPRLILMDEPFSALDEATRLDLCVEMLRLVSEGGSSVVFVTHSTQEAAFVCDRVLQMSERPGRIIREVRQAYGAERNRDLLTRAEFADAQAALRVQTSNA